MHGYVAPRSFLMIQLKVTIRKYCGARPGIHGLTCTLTSGNHTISEYLQLKKRCLLFVKATFRLHEMSLIDKDGGSRGLGIN